MSIDFACPKCKKKYSVKDELAGKAAKCAKCQQRIKIPVPVAVSALDAEPDLSDLFDEEFSALATSGEVVDSPKTNPQRSSASKRCPSCAKPLGANAVLCVGCGFDTRSGSHHKTKQVKPKARKSRAAKQTATLMQGIVFSVIGAAVGAAIWVGIAIVTDYEIGWIAWGLGAAAGAGMALGKGDDVSEFSGLIAAGISLLGIVGAKFGLYRYVISTIESMGVTVAQAKALSGEKLTFGAMFSPIDGLFILLAVASAYKIGSGQAED